MNNIILKARGVKEITRQESLNISKPFKTYSYCVISQEEIINTALEQISKQGLKLKSEFHKTDGSKNKFVGGFTINSQGNSEMDMFFGYKNSYDKSMSASYASGASIFICSNSAVSGEQCLTRKHTGNANNIITIAITHGISSLGEKFRQIEKDFQRMKEIEVTKKTYASLVGQLYLEQEIITAHQLSVVKGEMDRESYDYGIKDSLFNVYQAVTHSLKSSHPISWLNSHTGTHDFFCKEANILMLNPPSINIPLDISPRQLSLELEIPNTNIIMS